MSTRYNKAKEFSALKDSTKKWVRDNRFREVRIKSTGELITAMDYAESPNELPYVKVMDRNGNLFLCRLDDIDMG